MFAGLFFCNRRNTKVNIRASGAFFKPERASMFVGSPAHSQVMLQDS
jgi:hypothetical protein